MPDAGNLPGGLSGTPRHAAGWGHRTFTLNENPSEGFRIIPLGDPAEGEVGDIWLAERRLYASYANHAVVGTLRLRAEVIGVFPGNDRLVSADAHHLLSDGTIIVLGSFCLPSDARAGFNIAIVGGTGAYEGARGAVTVKAIDAATTQLTYNVLR